MKKGDFILIACVAVVAALFAIPQTHCAEGFNWATAHHPYIMAFFKFAILATLGEMLALRIREGVYNKKGFGVAPRMIVWGFLGMAIVAIVIHWGQMIVIHINFFDFLHIGEESNIIRFN